MMRNILFVIITIAYVLSSQAMAPNTTNNQAPANQKPSAEEIEQALSEMRERTKQEPATVDIDNDEVFVEKTCCVQ